MYEIPSISKIVTRRHVT